MTRSSSIPTSAAAPPTRTATAPGVRAPNTPLDYRFAPQWHAQLAYTYIEANYVDAYLTCVAAPCARPDSAHPSGEPLARRPDE